MHKPNIFGNSFSTVAIVAFPMLFVIWSIASLIFSPLYTSQKKGSSVIPAASGKVAQAFKAEYPALSKIYVKYSNNSAPTDKINVGKVILRKSGPEGTLIAEWSQSVSNEEQSYSFTPQLDSAGQNYYLEFSNSQNLVYSPKEVYPEGQLYFEGKPAQGDLYFVAEYAPNPGELIGGFFRQQERFGGLPGLALLCIAAAIGLGGVLLWLLAKYRYDLGKWLSGNRKTPWLIFGGLLLGLRLTFSLAFMLVTPLLQGPDEPGHIGRTLAMAQNQPDSSFSGLVADLMQRTDFIKHFPWLTYADNPAQLYPATAEQLQLPFYYWIAAGLVKLGNLFGASFSGQNYLARLASVLLGLMTVGAALGLGYLWRREKLGLALALPVSVALLPEAVHLSSVANNDNGAIAFGAVATFGMALLFLRGPRPLYFGVVLVGLGLSIFNKASANALIPGFAIGFYILALLHFKKSWIRRTLLAFPLIALLLGLAVVFLITDHSRAASGWYYNPILDVGQHAERQLLAEAHSGQFVLKIGPESRAIEQQVNLFGQADFQRVRIQGWIRAANNTEQAAFVRLQTATETITEQRIAAGATWQSFEFEANVNATEISHTRIKAYLRLQFASASSGSVYLDDLSLVPTDNSSPNLLANPSLEQSVWTFKNDWQGAGRSRHSFAGDMLDTVQNGAALDYGAIFLQNWLFLFITFWGAFGWSQVLFGLPIYLLGAIIFLVAIFGFLRTIIRTPKLGTRNAYIYFCLFTALLTMFSLQFIRLPTSWMYDGTPDITHSRHAFAALLPQLIILLVGLGGFGPAAKLKNNAIIEAEYQEEYNVSAVPKNKSILRQGWLGLWVWSVFLFVLTLSALLNTIFPYYYNN